ncbi:MAG: exodeoxyribonuclease VII small subunit [Candidatus Omnitrophota bacterium]|nr:MAG: exodeoxyribonuclease VII small subunit [Candidatus Omnitrophota bacterium]
MTKDKHSFEEDLEKLQKIVDELAKGKLTLAESIKKYEEGVKLIKECSLRLNEAQRKVQLLTKKNGKFSLEDFDEEELAEEEK